jgi:cytochrome c556
MPDTRQLTPRTLYPALLAALLTLSACSDTAVPDTHPQRWVSQRQAVFKDFTRTLEPMGLAARERRPYNPSEFAGSALALQALARKPWPLFPADSQYPPTRAQPAVWTEPAAFEQAQQAYLAAVDALVLAAQTGKLEAVRPAVGQVQQACKSCHDRFRMPKAAH